MLKLIRGLLFLVGLVILVVLSIDNRGPVDLSFWPLPYATRLPLFAIFLIALAVGAVLGGLASWLARLPERAEARRLRRQVEAVEEQDRRRRAAEEQALVDEARRKTQALAL